MPLQPDSNELNDMHSQLGTGEQKPGYVTDVTWRLITKRYAEVRELHTGGEQKAEGGQAFVFDAKEKRKPGRPVAIKVYKGRSTTDLQLFERELSVMGATHLRPHLKGLLVDLVDRSREPCPQPFIVMERIQGVEPAVFVQGKSITERIDLFERLCRAMQKLHEANLVLRDVNARNVLVEAGGKIRFIDFAAASEHIKAFEHASVSVPLATEGFVPIEVIKGEIKASQQTDLYATCSIGFFVLTDKHKGDVLTASGISDENHPRAAALWDAELARVEVPAAVRQIILKGLTKPDRTQDLDPRVYATVGAIADDIVSWKEQLRLQSLTRARRAALLKHSLVTVLLLIAVGLPGLHYWREWQKAQQQSELVVNRRMIAEEQKKIDVLATKEHAAVKTLITEAARVTQQLNEATSLESQLQLASDALSTLR